MNSNYLTIHSRLRRYTLIASIETKTTTPNARIIPIVWKVGIVTPKASRTAGIWRTTAVSINCEMMETVSKKCGGAWKTLYGIELKVKAMISSAMMNRKNVSVRAYVISNRSWKERKKKKGISIRSGLVCG
jgi:hypothetical protein